MKLTQALLKELFDYDSKHGVFINKFTRGPARKGKIAGCVGAFGKADRRIIIINKTRIYASRLVWLYHKGYWPKHQIDHINGIATDDRIENLREATGSENNQNQHKHKDGRLPFIGVSYSDKRKQYRARITHHYIEYNLGNFNTPEEAYAAYCAAKRRLHKFNPEVRAE